MDRIPKVTIRRSADGASFFVAVNITNTNYEYQPRLQCQAGRLIFARAPLAADQKSYPGNEQRRLDQQDEDTLRQPVQNPFPDE